MKRGVWQLQRLQIKYCEHGGSSEGVRRMLKRGIEQFEQTNPQIEISTVVNNGHHPVIIGEYLNGNSRTTCVKNTKPIDILGVMQTLRDTWGKKVQTLKTSERHVTKTPSIQGVWTSDLRILSEEEYTEMIENQSTPSL